MSHEEEICNGCVLANLCKAGTAYSSEENGEIGECSKGLRKKAVLLMFWVPLLIIGAALFLLVGLLKWHEALSFGLVVVVLIVYYIILKLKLNKNN